MPWPFFCVPLFTEPSCTMCKYCFTDQSSRYPLQHWMVLALMVLKAWKRFCWGQRNPQKSPQYLFCVPHLFSSYFILLLLFFFILLLSNLFRLSRIDSFISSWLNITSWKHTILYQLEPLRSGTYLWLLRNAISSSPALPPKRIEQLRQ